MRHPRASHWFKASDLSARNIDPEIASWLSDQGSLTRRLVEFSRQDFSVRLLSQNWSRAEFEESKLLNIPLRQRVLSRQVQLICDDAICVYARSIIPLKTLKGKHRRLLYLNERPLGSYLFSSPGLRRNTQHLAIIARKDPLFDLALQGTASECERIWGRRSLFTINESPLLVSEFFLPSLFSKPV